MAECRGQASDLAIDCDSLMCDRSSSPSRFWLLTGILLIALNLRPALSSIGPLVDVIQADLGLSSTLMGTLTTLPLFAFGVMSVLTPILTRRFGSGYTLLGAMALLTAGLLLRSAPGVISLFTGTLLFGIAIAVGNVTIPVLTKDYFAESRGLVTGLYSSLMALGAAVAAGLSVPLVADLGLSWRQSLASWAALSILALVIWAPQARKISGRRPERSLIHGLRALSRSALMWQLALFMGLQSLSFYVVLAWLPAMLSSAGYSPVFAGWMLAASQATGVIGSVIIPILAGRSQDQHGIMAALMVMELISLIGLMFMTPGWLILWVCCVGFVLGATFGLALLMIILRASDSETATLLSGLVQSIGYLVAAIGPLLIGMIYDATHRWNDAILVLIGVVIIKLILGLSAARDRVV